MPEQKRLRQVLGENIRRLRQESHISQEEFASLCGLHRTYISDVERCNRNISLDNVERIARALHVPACTLLEDTPDEN